MGRKTSFTQEKADQICEMISKGISLLRVCDELELNRSVVNEWVSHFPAFASQLALARSNGEDVLAEKLLDVSRGGKESTGDVVRDKLIIETCLKLLGKWNPKKYGDRIQQDITNNDPLRELNADQIRQYMDRLRSAEAGASEGTGEPQAGTVPPIH